MLGNGSKLLHLSFFILSLSLVYTLLTGDSLVKAFIPSFIRARRDSWRACKSRHLRAVFIHNYHPAPCSSNLGSSRYTAALNYIERWRAVNVLSRGISREGRIVVVVVVVVKDGEVGTMRIELDISFRRIRKKEGKGRNEAARMRTLSTRSRFIPGNVYTRPPSPHLFRCNPLL